MATSYKQKCCHFTWYYDDDFKKLNHRGACTAVLLVIKCSCNSSKNGPKMAARTAAANSYFNQQLICESFSQLIKWFFYLYNGKHCEIVIYLYQFPTAQSEVFKFVLLSNQQSKTQTLFIYSHKWQREAANPHMRRAGTSKKWLK